MLRTVDILSITVRWHFGHYYNEEVKDDMEKMKII